MGSEVKIKLNLDSKRGLVTEVLRVNGSRFLVSRKEKTERDYVVRMSLAVFSSVHCRHHLWSDTLIKFVCRFVTRVTSLCVRQGTYTRVSTQWYVLSRNNFHNPCTF